MPQMPEFQSPWVDRLDSRQMLDTYRLSQIKSDGSRELLKSMRLRVKWRLKDLLKPNVDMTTVHDTVGRILKDLEGFEKLYEYIDDVPPDVEAA